MLDILIHGVFQDLPNKSIYADGPQEIASKLDADDTAELFVNASTFLASSLNIGNFEGVSGSKQDIVLRL